MRQRSFEDSVDGLKKLVDFVACSPVEVREL